MLLDNIKRTPLSQMKGGAAAACIALASVLLTGCGQIAGLVANNAELTEFRVKGTELHMQGPINSKTPAQFEQVVAAHPGLTTLIEHDVPGSLDDDAMIALAYRVRALGLNTHLTATSEIHSGGVDLFLAGVKRTMEPGAVVGVHAWSDGSKDADDYPRDAPEHEQNRLYIERMLGTDDFYWFTITAAPADDIHIMTPAEISSYKLLTR